MVSHWYQYYVSTPQLAHQCWVLARCLVKKFYNCLKEFLSFLLSFFPFIFSKWHTGPKRGRGYNRTSVFQHGAIHPLCHTIYTAFNQIEWGFQNQICRDRIGALGKLRLPLSSPRHAYLWCGPSLFYFSLYSKSLYEILHPWVTCKL